jgi:hypothetical protein
MHLLHAAPAIPIAVTNEKSRKRRELAVMFVIGVPWLKSVAAWSRTGVARKAQFCNVRLDLHNDLHKRLNTTRRPLRLSSSVNAA